eukprot:TRINITY_DN47243_c0_g1_i1.p1 TRINITY_DN47243_c0_g1~~TRINITY_DN47243_c0_g1_i1.p1  ORF type:complete len:277 (+),score=26.94 TRINITY_DN47243_c0_g1_i1:77-907(+)
MAFPCDCSAGSLYCTEGLAEPCTKAQSRLQRRKLEWLRHLAYSRETLLRCRLAAGLGMTCEAELQVSPPSLACDSRTVSVACQTACTDMASDDARQTPNMMSPGDNDLYLELKGVLDCAPLKEFECALAEWSRGTRSAVDAAERLISAGIPDDVLDEDDFLPVGTCVVVMDELTALLFNFVDSLGVVKGHSRSLGQYTVCFLSSTRSGTFPWRAVFELDDVVLCGLTGNPSLNGTLAFVENIIEGTIPRICVTLESGRRVSVRHTCVKAAGYLDIL